MLNIIAHPKKKSASAGTQKGLQKKKRGNTSAQNEAYHAAHKPTKHMPQTFFTPTRRSLGCAMAAHHWKRKAKKERGEMEANGATYARARLAKVSPAHSAHSHTGAHTQSSEKTTPYNTTLKDPINTIRP